MAYIEPPEPIVIVWPEIDDPEVRFETRLASLVEIIQKHFVKKESDERTSNDQG